MRSPMALFLAAFTLASLAACGGKVVVDAEGTVAVPTLTCESNPPTPFPAFDKSCASDADCIVKDLRSAGCCTPTRVVGVTAAAGADFDAAKASCESKEPFSPCDCFGGQIAEDGNHAGDLSKIEVACQSSQCLTFVP